MNPEHLLRVHLLFINLSYLKYIRAKVALHAEGFLIASSGKPLRYWYTGTQRFAGAYGSGFAVIHLKSLGSRSKHKAIRSQFNRKDMFEKASKLIDPQQLRPAFDIILLVRLRS